MFDTTHVHRFDPAFDMPLILDAIFQRHASALWPVSRYKLESAAVGCLYRGPCIIGCLLLEDERVFFDKGDDPTVSTHYDSDAFEFNPEDGDSHACFQLYSQLQVLHDEYQTARHTLGRARLTSLDISSMYDIPLATARATTARKAFFAHVRQMAWHYRSVQPDAARNQPHGRIG